LSEQTEKELIKNDILGKELFTTADIKKRVSELGKEITKDYKYKDLLLVSILRGGVIFLADLMKEIDLPLSIDFMSISSYGITDTSTGVVRITKDLDESIEGKDVLIVEDIIDTGLTIIGEKYIVGYGLDYKQKFRNLESIYELKFDTVKKDLESLKGDTGI